MNKAQFKLGICLLAAQLVLLLLTLGFHSGMDAQAETAGIAGIIQEAGR